MRKLICLLLTAAALLFAAGCTPESDPNSVTFYYLRQSEDYIYQDEEGVLAGEQRTISDPDSGLQYLLRLYLEGPQTEGLLSPFPKGTRILDVSLEEDVLTVTLSEQFASLVDMRQTLACACLCRTCFSLTDAETIRLLCGQMEMTWHADSFTLTDGSITPAG